MADSVTLRTRKFQRNPLLARVQADGRVSSPTDMPLKFRGNIIEDHDDNIDNTAFTDIIHPDQAGISKANLQEKLASLYKATPEQVSVFGLRTAFGGGKTTAFACIYDSVEARKKFDAKHRLVRAGLATKAERASRQQRKQRKNRMKTLRGTEKTKGKKAKKDS
ncbi:ribosomal protein L23/L15e core domain-containing protein [Xylaria arbuscula]|nr:ribosomal protein L23/L15e core domain-containing protein [Xylaria arbuscula]